MPSRPRAGSGISQAIYYAKNIKSAAAGTNTVTVTFNTATQYVDLRALEYSGLDLVNPFDVGASASGTSNSANSGAVTTTAAHELIIGAGTTAGGFSAAGSGFTTRIITSPDAGHCRRPVRDRYRELQRHRIALGVRSMGDAGRDLQGGELVWHRSGAWIARRAWKQTPAGDHAGIRRRRWCQAGRLDVQDSDRSNAGVGSGRIFASRSARSRLACASANVRCFSASNRRTFSIAIAAWPAKNSRSAIWLSENDRTSHRRTAREGYMNAVVEPIHSKQRLRAQGWRLG